MITAVTMSLFFKQIFSLITTLPGNLIYHLVLVFCVAGALQGAIHLLRSSGFPQARRMVLGLLILLFLQVMLFVISGLVWQGVLGTQIVLPPLDRAITALSLVVIAWMWTFPEPARPADAAALLLGLLTVTMAALTMVFWNKYSLDSQDFNRSPFEIIWQAYSLAIVILGIVIAVIRRPNGWNNCLAILSIGFLGHLLGLIFRLPGDFSGIVRLAQLMMFPILLTISQRFPTPSLTTESVIAIPVPEKARKSEKSDKADKSEQAAPRERRRYSTDPKTFHALMTLASETDAGKIGAAMTRGIAQAMLADLCFLIMVGEDKSLTIACGYDLIREENLGGTDVNKDAIPLLTNAIQRGRPLRLPASSTSSDLKGLGQVLGLSSPGHLLSIPVTSTDGTALGSILILSPYSNRLWSAEDQAYLSNVAPLFVPILERSKQLSAQALERDKALQEAAETRKKYEEAVKALDETRERTSQTQLQADNMAALLVMQEETQKELERLKTENEELRNMDGLPASNAQLERELRQTLQEMARMQNAMAEANMKILELEARAGTSISSEQVEVIASISQELRQPMSSIVGYTDLLMGESVGILGALQRKFVERIKASTERIGGLVDDLIQITNLEVEKRDIQAELVDLNLIIDNAMAYTSTQIREKNITLRMDLPETTPPIQADRDAIQQILIHLLQNATAATQAEGTITLRIRLQKENDDHFLSMHVTDSGGGIAATDIPNVFERRYRAEHSLIQGLGDTGVGLSIAKTLVETHSGRIWVETDAGAGSTFSVLIPVSLDVEEK